MSGQAATPYTKVLIANRGEIALRVMRSARAAGYRTVAVYSTADADSLHVQAADQAVWIGESLPAQSYLNIPALIDAARRTGADAVHPGYGFLAENAAFVQACREAGLVFIGPAPEAIAAMGHKGGAKGLMQQAGVPCVPGYLDDDTSDARLAAEAERLGYPVMIKAVAGGGGRGMRLVPDADGFPELLRSARSEALNAFGDATVMLERAVVEPRHIEIQVVADRHGTVVHLGERDCSVQRRHQKIIEEAPSPAVTPALRERMGAAAVAAARAIGYEGVGTIEFLLDRDGAFYFMEMNTRLQVEHPVTEALTGLDLVALQLRIAAGEPLGLSQDDIRATGHAIEVRLCAEDVPNGFLPQSGTLAAWQPPENVRVEHALRAGAEIPPYYDSMIAKVIAYGANREEARRRLVAGLIDTVALGVVTNQVFLQRCLQHPVFVVGQATTGFVGANRDELLRRDDAADARAGALAAVLLIETAGATRRPSNGRRLNRSWPTPLRYEIDGRPLASSVSDAAAHHVVQIDDRRWTVECVALEGLQPRVAIDGVATSIAWVRDGVRLQFLYEGVPYDVRDTSRAASPRRGVAEAGDGLLRASMNGRVVAVLVVPGQRVEAGQPVLTLEAMKMEHVHAAPRAGTVKALHVAVGDQVSAARIVAEIEAAAPG
jgi:geranyl-CoA carboxylase alpha subunit